MKRLSILGSTGSIGTNTLSIVARFPERFSVAALTAWKNTQLLARQVARFKPELTAVRDAEAATDLKARLSGQVATRVLWGPEGFEEAATLSNSDMVVAAMVGAAGIRPTLAAIHAGKDIALANKETLVAAGEVVMAAAAAKGIRILPVDSEHSAVFQCLQGNRREDLDRILLTASGGPFRTRPAGTFETITPADALSHPNWQMGAKISIDSATLMNKGLEVLEARWLFDVPVDRIQVVVHPQSIVHSMAVFRDGSVMAQMGVPDMKGAIALALSHPERLPIGQPVPDFAAIGSLTFEKPDMVQFPCLSLALDAAREGGTLPAVMNAANEAAVAAFLEGRIGFTGIPRVVEEAMARHRQAGPVRLEAILEADREGRQTAEAVISRIAAAS